MTALVTGAALRLGRAMPLELARAGHDVAIHYAGSADAAEDTAKEVRGFGVRAVTLQADLTVEDDMQTLLPRAAQAFAAPITVLINNASIFEYDNLASATRACNRLCAWSITTAATITSPLITICQKDDTPIMINPSDRMPITKAPMIVPIMRPRPPDIDVPPRTAAAIAFSSKNSPVAGWAALSWDAMINPTSAAIRPENM